MKKSTSFRISKEASDILKIRSSVFKISQTAVLESLIKEFSPSTDDEKNQQYINRELSFKIFDSLNPNQSHRKAWMNGFKEGWKQFQTRKKTSLFNLP
jgi:hypothetical protein